MKLRSVSLSSPLLIAIPIPLLIATLIPTSIVLLILLPPLIALLILLLHDGITRLVAVTLLLKLTLPLHLPGVPIP